jgi:hypothetical protein
MLPKVWESVKEWTLTLPSEFQLWELEYWWTPYFSESDFNGQNPLDQIVFYIIEIFLEHICLKWVHMTHLDTSNTSYGQKKGRESNCQFDSRPLKVENRPDFFTWRWRATYRWKVLDEGYNFASDPISIKGLHTKLWPLKIAGDPTLRTSGLPLDKMTFGC